MRVVVCFCTLSGAALDCAIGSLRLSEQVLACRIILGSLAKSLFIGDRHFGVFRIAQAARQAGQKVLLRMTDRRARKLLGRTLAPVITRWIGNPAPRTNSSRLAPKS